MLSERTRVYITVDVECANERLSDGHIVPPLSYDVRVWGRLVNQRDPLGIELIMSELEAHGQRGTFFVESIGAHYFGTSGLAEVCQGVRGRGHDVQLHLHPGLRRPDFRSRGEEPTEDDIGSYSEEEQVALLREARDLLVEAGVPEEELCGYRAGNFGASNVTWRAMRQVGLNVSSNFNPCYFGKCCKMRLDDAPLGLFATPEPEVWELPITNFRDPRGGFRHVQITAVSAQEMIQCLRRYRALGVQEITVVTHSFEFFFLDDADRRRGHVNRINVDRLRGLCRFLQEHDDEFEVDTVGALGQRLGAGVQAARPVFAGYPSVGALPYARRLAEQAVKRLAQRVSFA